MLVRKLKKKVPIKIIPIQGPTGYETEIADLAKSIPESERRVNSAREADANSMRLRKKRIMRQIYDRIKFSKKMEEEC